MDEPLSNLDAKLRTETRSQIVQLQRQLGTTTIYVTHDQTEAMTMGDRIAVMHQGEIQQLAPPLEIYNHPANCFVAEFIGSPPMNLIPVRLESRLLLTHSDFHLNLPETWSEVTKHYQGRSLLLGIRPEHLTIAPPDTQNLQVRIDLVEALGNETYIKTSLTESKDTSLQVRIPPDIVLKPGDRLSLSLNLEKIHLFELETGRSLQTER